MVAISNSRLGQAEHAQPFRQADEPRSPVRPQGYDSGHRRSWNTLTETYQTDEELWAWTGSWDL